MTPEDTDKIARIVRDYGTRANDAKVYLDIMESRLTWLDRWLKRTKTLTILAPVLLTISFAPVHLPKPLEIAWIILLSLLTATIAVLVAISYGQGWDEEAADLRVLIESLRVQQAGFQRQAGMAHDNANNSGYTHRLDAERHDLLKGRMGKHVTNQAFSKRAAEMGLSPKPQVAPEAASILEAAAETRAEKV